VNDNGSIVGGEEWQGKVYDREERKKLLRTERNHRILHMAMEWMNVIDRVCCYAHYQTWRQATITFLMSVYLSLPSQGKTTTDFQKIWPEYGGIRIVVLYPTVLNISNKIRLMEMYVYILSKMCLIVRCIIRYQMFITSQIYSKEMKDEGNFMKSAMVCTTDLRDIIKDEMCLTPLPYVKLEMLTILVRNSEENGLCTANT
jgi:hypothetical protein